MQETKNIHAKILEFQNNIGTIKKDATNPHFKNTYATLGQILSAVTPILNALKLTLTQPVVEGFVYTVITDIETGEALNSGIKLPENLSPQNIGSAITYFRRYTLSSLLSLEIEEDDDGNAASSHTNASTEEKQWLNKYTDKSKTKTTETWDKVLGALKSGKYTIEDVKSKYKLSKDLERELKSI